MFFCFVFVSRISIKKWFSFFFFYRKSPHDIVWAMHKSNDSGDGGGCKVSQGRQKRKIIKRTWLLSRALTQTNMHKHGESERKLRFVQCRSSSFFMFIKLALGALCRLAVMCRHYFLCTHSHTHWVGLVCTRHDTTDWEMACRRRIMAKSRTLRSPWT